MILVLDNIRSTHNVGAMFRTAEGAGVSEVILVGITPAPLDRFGRSRSDIAKAAVGAQELVPWKYFESTTAAIEYVLDKVAVIISLEQSSQSIDYKTLSPVAQPRGAALVMGNEVDGVSDSWLEISKHHIEIYMQGSKESLNVSTACGIALFRLLDI